MTRVTTINGVRIAILEPEEEEICTSCGKKDELRPYGPNFSKVCFDCAMKDEDGTRRRFGELILGEEPTQ